MDYWLRMKAIELKLQDSKALELKQMNSDPSPIIPSCVTSGHISTEFYRSWFPNLVEMTDKKESDCVWNERREQNG